MNIETAKQINLADYLHSLGYSPVKQQGINLWYKSPLREETEASCMLPTMYLTCWSGLRNKHRMYTRYLSLLASKTLSVRASSSWR